MTVEKYKNPKILFTVIIMALVGALTGCAGGKEFETVPQKGANRTGVFPRFSQMPQGETAQFTKAERDQLANQLTQDRSNLERAATEAVPTEQDIARQKQAAAKSAEETLRQIEQAGQ
ncbi:MULTISPECIES: hypothetical protein [unclassified Bartonella]|uniref:hypothetical protein n=1 Tax=unclassified Bartonella TaxID=2645622 RepID=UPI0015F83296|nr:MULTISPECIES: hypothetical protein [unclassified Bartonella]UXN04351.1 hypothetical protein N6B01_04825 [Bartonella sp. HY406]